MMVLTVVSFPVVINRLIGDSVAVLVAVLFAVVDASLVLLVLRRTGRGVVKSGGGRRPADRRVRTIVGFRSIDRSVIVGVVVVAAVAVAVAVAVCTSTAKIKNKINSMIPE